MVTLFTVGYGDLYPKTPEGRISAVALMFVGIALFGWVTAALASLFVENEGKAKKHRNAEMLHDRLDELGERLNRIEFLLGESESRRESVGSVLDDG